MEIQEYISRIQELENRYAQSQEENEQLRAQIKELKELVQALQYRLGLNSSTSSKPPSSDGLRKVSKERSLRKSTNKFGGQEGHKGNTLRQTDDPDQIKEYAPINCDACGNTLEDIEPIDFIERQEIDIVISKQVIAHRASVKICNCGRRNNGVMPKHITGPVQFSNNVKAMAVYLTNQFIPKKRIEDMFFSLFGIKISDTTLLSFDKECAQKLTPLYKLIETLVKQAEVKHADETGIRVAGKTNWLHVLCTELFTHYRVDEKRGSTPENVDGTLIHDHWKPYFVIANIMHALCNAHHLRELKALIEMEKEQWAQEMYDLLQHASSVKNPTPEQQQEISEKYDLIVSSGLAYHSSLAPLTANGRKKRTGHNLLLRLSNFKPETLRFLYNDNVPFTNNLAERDIRMMKLQQKVSGCFRTMDGAKIFAVIRSFVSTVTKHKLAIFESLSSVFEGVFDLESFAYV